MVGDVAVRAVVGLIGIAIVYGLLYVSWTAFADALERRNYPRWYLFLGLVGLYLILTTRPAHPPRRRRWNLPSDARRGGTRP